MPTRDEIYQGIKAASKKTDATRALQAAAQRMNEAAMYQGRNSPAYQQAKAEYDKAFEAFRIHKLFG